jgi:hypothetical protein
MHDEGRRVQMRPERQRRKHRARKSGSEWTMPNSSHGFSRIHTDWISISPVRPL